MPAANVPKPGLAKLSPRVSLPERNSLVSIDEFSKVDFGGKSSSSEIAASSVVNSESKVNELENWDRKWWRLNEIIIREKDLNTTKEESQLTVIWYSPSTLQFTFNSIVLKYKSSHLPQLSHTDTQDSIIIPYLSSSSVQNAKQRKH